MLCGVVSVQLKGQMVKALAVVSSSPPDVARSPILYKEALRSAQLHGRATRDPSECRCRKYRPDKGKEDAVGRRRAVAVQLPAPRLDAGLDQQRQR